jgi:hypothetical protein
MTALAQLRQTALSLPETAEQGIRFGMVAFTVRGKRFASMDAGTSRAGLDVVGGHSAAHRRIHAQEFGHRPDNDLLAGVLGVLQDDVEHEGPAQVLGRNRVLDLQQ